MITWSKSTKPCPIITWDGVVSLVHITMLIISTIWFTLDLSVFRVPRPCLYMLGSSSQPKCIACVNLAYTRCIRALESITPDHHVVLRNTKLSQQCTVRGNTFLKLLWGIILFTTVVLSKQDEKHDKHHMQSNNNGDKMIMEPRRWRSKELYDIGHIMSLLWLHVMFIMFFILFT